MNLSRLVSSIKESEGYRKNPYLDSLGYWTVGFGHLIHTDILQHSEALEFGKLMAFYSDRVRHESWLDDDIKNAIFKAKEWVGEPLWSELGDLRREVLVEMRFQLGGKQKKFTRMKEALNNRDFAGVSASMLGSLWAKQTPQRVMRMAGNMQTGV